MSYKFTFSIIASYRDEECAICLEKEGGRWTTLDCDHAFHKSCIDRYLNGRIDARCPICRQSIEEDRCVVS